MEPSTTLLILLALLAVYLAGAVWRFGIQMGTFDLFSGKSEESSHGFLTDVARVTVSPAKRTLTIARPGNSLFKCGLGEVSRVSIRVFQGPEALNELGIGYDIYDFLDIIRKRGSATEWHVIFVSLPKGKDIPVYLAGQYTGLDLILLGRLKMERGILSAIGISPLIERRVQNVAMEIKRIIEFDEASPLAYQA